MMDKYNHFSIEDFVWDSFFRQWVLTPTRETDTVWNDWLDENGAARDKVKEAKEIVLALRVNDSRLSKEEIDASIMQTIARISQPNVNRSLAESESIRPLYKHAWFRIAASVTFLLVTGWLAKSYFSTETMKVGTTISELITSPSTDFIEKVNDSNIAMLVKLEDGSQINLTPGSRIRYRKDFVGEKREVYLVGEAFFEVSKDPLHPFFVYANELVTKVLGTSFTIRALENSREVTVEVKTGRVSVFSKSDPNVAYKKGSSELEGLVLSPNQKIVFKRDEVRMVKTLVEKPEIILDKAQVPYFSFEDTPVSEVFETIEKAYGIEILYDAELLKDCPLTATLENQPLNEKLTIICKAVEATYEILDGQIVIHSSGCKN